MAEREFHGWDNNTHRKRVAEEAANEELLHRLEHAAAHRQAADDILFDLLKEGQDAGLSPRSMALRCHYEPNTVRRWLKVGHIGHSYADGES